MPITPIYAAILALIYFVLSLKVIKFRRGYRIAYGYANKKDMQKAIRAHANFSEYVPITLLLIWFVEVLTHSVLAVHVLGGLLVIGRVVHAFGLGQVKENFRLRVFGMLLTFIAMLGCSIRIIWYYLPF